VDGVVVIHLAGELDMSTAAELDSRLAKVVGSGTAGAVVLDLSDVSFVDACCVGVMVTAWSSAARRGRELRVDGLHGVPARVFDLLGLDWMLGGNAGGR
jgi:anti-sigma B factor antagonist